MCAPQLAKLRSQKEALEGLCRSLQAQLKSTQGRAAQGSESVSGTAPEAAQVPDTASPAPQQPGAPVSQPLLEPVLVPEQQPSGAQAEPASAVGAGLDTAALEPAAPTESAEAQEGDDAQEGAAAQ